MNAYDTRKYQMRTAQLERVKEELRAFAALWYNQIRSGGGEEYRKIKPLVEKTIQELLDICGWEK